MDDDVKEFFEDKRDSIKEFIGDIVGGIKKFFGDKMDDNKLKVFFIENVKSLMFYGVLIGENGFFGGIMEEIVCSLWYIIEGLNGEEKRVDNCNFKGNGDLFKSQEQLFILGELNCEDKGIEMFVFGKFFMFGYWRVVFFFFVIIVLLVESMLLFGGEIVSGVIYFERS